jgi:tetrahydromethanopterin S-methyltransferase subunit F
MAAPTSPAPASSGGKGLIPPEWSAQAADTVVDAIGKVRDKATRPAQIAARAVVYGLIAAVIGVIAVVLLIVVLLRMFNNWVPGQLWIAYAGLAVVFLLGGLLCLKRANQPAPQG